MSIGDMIARHAGPADDADFGRAGPLQSRRASICRRAARIDVVDQDDPSPTKRSPVSLERTPDHLLAVPCGQATKCSSSSGPLQTIDDYGITCQPPQSRGEQG